MRAESSPPSPAVQRLVGLRRPGTLLPYVGELHVVAGDPDLDAPFGQFRRQLGGHVGEQLEDAARQRAAQQVGDALGHLGHGVVAELPNAQHIGAQPVDRQ